MWTEGLGTGFMPNARRCISVMYNTEAVQAFLQGAGLQLLMRAHQVKPQGFRVDKSSKVLTVFTSSQYCGGTNSAGVAFVTPGVVRAVIRARSDSWGSPMDGFT